MTIVSVNNFVFKLFKFGIVLFGFFEAIMMENKFILYGWHKLFSLFCFSIILLAKKIKQFIDCIMCTIMVLLA